MTTLAALNSQQAMQSRLAEGRIPRFGPMLMLVARPAFILLAQGLTYLLFLLLDVPNAAVVIRNWWPVYGTLVDVGCLGLLFWLTRREGLRLLDLTGFDIRRVKTDIPLGIGLFLLIFPVTIFGGGALAQWIAYGKLNPEFPEFHRNHAVFSRSEPARPGELIELEQGLLIEIGINVNRVDRDNRGEQGGVAGHA